MMVTVFFIIIKIEIEARPNMESDKKLDKLENFLGRLNSKGAYITSHFLLMKCTSGLYLK